MSFFKKNKRNCIYILLMSLYFVPNQQTSKVFVFLRIMILKTYLRKLSYLQSQFSNNSEMFFYLITKYYERFTELSTHKQSSKKKYQECTKQYSNIGIRVSPAIHQIIKYLSDVTGYSMSAIVRFLIEWESIENNGVQDRRNTLEGNEALFNEIVITGLKIHLTYSIHHERVEERFIWNLGFS